jgi:hypothetical protein
LTVLEAALINDRTNALAEFLQVFDERLAAGPVIDRRAGDRRGAPRLIEASRVPGPVGLDLVYWASPPAEATFGSR